MRFSSDRYNFPLFCWGAADLDNFTAGEGQIMMFALVLAGLRCMVLRPYRYPFVSRARPPGLESISRRNADTLRRRNCNLFLAKLLDAQTHGLPDRGAHGGASRPRHFALRRRHSAYCSWHFSRRRVATASTSFITIFRSLWNADARASCHLNGS